MDAATKPKESARQRFLRLAPARVDAALKKISLIGNLAGAGYQYEPTEAKQIIAALNEAVHDVERKFSTQKGKRGGFTFAARRGE